jgi:hypothetical protein
MVICSGSYCQTKQPELELLAVVETQERYALNDLSRGILVRVTTSEHLRQLCAQYTDSD